MWFEANLEELVANSLISKMNQGNCLTHYVVCAILGSKTLFILKNLEN